MATASPEEIKRSSEEKSDVEKSGAYDTVAEVESSEGVYDVVAKHENSWASPLWKITGWLSRYGVESRGIERVPPDMRWQSPSRSFFMWFAANCNISTFALGTLGTSIWFLDLRTCILTIIFFNLLSTLPVALFSVWGARTGLRQMTIGRYSFGGIAVLFPTALNLIACIGWSSINAIAAASALRAVSDTNKIPGAAAIVVITVATLAITFFGYRVVHAFELCTAPIAAVMFIILLGTSASSFSAGDFVAPGMDTAAGVLSFGAAIVGFGFGWTSLAADYTVSMKSDVSGPALFGWTYLGLNLPLILVQCLGAACMSTFANRPDWEARYEADGIGGLLVATTSPAGGFGKFVVVMLALTIIGNNVPNLYSFALTAQVLGSWFQAIPRVAYAVLATGIAIAIGIVGETHFEEALDTLLVLLSYWLSIYCVILLSEHFIFRRGKWSNYDLSAYGEYAKLPVGFAAAFAVCCGIAGAVVGMASVWYVGPLALDISSPYGGDIGFELSGAFAFIAYVPARYLERKRWSR